MTYNEHSPVSRGMKLWYLRSVPLCRDCKKVRLVRHDRRKAGRCAKCERQFLKLPKVLQIGYEKYKRLVDR